MPIAVRVLVAALTGFLLSALVAPWGYHRLHWVAYLPLFWILRPETPRANFWLVVVYGTVAEALIFSWIADTINLFSNIPWAGAWAVNGLFAVVFAVPYFITFWMVHRARERLGDLWMIWLPSWLVLVEWCTSAAILFPYNQGVSQFREPLVWQIVSVTGVSGVSWLMLYFNATFAEGIYRAREGRRFPVLWASSAVSLAALVVCFGAWRFPKVEAALAAAPVRRVQQIQSADTMLVRMRQPRSEAFGFWAEQTRRLPKGSVDLAVWPEGSVPYQLNTGTASTDLWDLVQLKDFDLVVGAGTRERDAEPGMGEEERVRIFNSVYTYARSALAHDPARTPDGDWTAVVAAGCDLEAARIRTPPEALLIAEAGEAAAGDATCVGRLRALAAQLSGTMKVGDPVLGALRRDPDVWGRLRALTERLDGPLSEDTFGRRGEVWFWTVQEASCVDDDCRKVAVRCAPELGCDAFPEAPHYDKLVPLPFGEYLPLAGVFPWLADLIEGPGNFRAGTEAVVFDVEGARLATPICYEGILGYLCDDFERPDLFVNVTNDAWFGETAASDLHGMLVAVRATELGVPVFRSTYSGKSFVVEPHGRIYAETALFEVVHRIVPVRLTTVPTFYGRWGDWFVALCAVVVLLGRRALTRDGSEAEPPLAA
jgi:apolipoprotein N-acyltransferase